MRPARPALPLLLALAAGLSGCSRTTDTFKPHISIGSQGGVSRERSFVVDGYAIDDTGVTQITVDGKPIPILPGSRKLAHFQFKTNLEGVKGQYTIAARDAAGNSSSVVLPVSVDPTPPVIKVTRFERSGNAIRVAGTVSDNGRVAEVSVDGNRLNITPGQKVDFYAETTGIWADVVATDAAGNKTTLRAR